MKYIFTIIAIFIPYTVSTTGYDECLSFNAVNDMYSIEESIHSVHITVYHAVAEQCNADWMHTADMTYIGTDVNAMYKHRIVAVSRDLLDEHGLSMGDTIRGHGLSVPEYNGKWVVHDKMNRRYSKRMDFLVNPGMKSFQKNETTYIWK